MRPTKYNTRITIIMPTKIDNLIGGWKYDYDNPEWTITTWASVLPIKGLKKMEYTRLGYTTIYEVEMRARETNPDGECRITWGGNNYQVVAISVDEKVNMDIGRTD
jgi:hypothetical protein